MHSVRHNTTEEDSTQLPKRSVNKPLWLMSPVRSTSSMQTVVLYVVLGAIQK